MKDKHKFTGTVRVPTFVPPDNDPKWNEPMPEGKFEVYGAGTDYFDIPQFIVQVKPFRLRLFGKDII
jgi:hypothetical protein